MMKIITGSRSTGKTKALLYHAKENDAIVVCRNPSAMEAKAHAYGIVGLEFMSYNKFACDEVSEIATNGVPENYVIDDVDVFLKELNVIGITSTNEE